MSKLVLLLLQKMATAQHSMAQQVSQWWGTVISEFAVAIKC
jgi:hypothetical protein